MKLKGKYAKTSLNTIDRKHSWSTEVIAHHVKSLILCQRCQNEQANGATYNGKDVDEAEDVRVRTPKHTIATLRAAFFRLSFSFMSSATFIYYKI